jgi:hypothetical protein
MIGMRIALIGARLDRNGMGYGTSRTAPLMSSDCNQIGIELSAGMQLTLALAVIGDLETQLQAFVEHCNHQHSHERLNNATGADASFGSAPADIRPRERMERQVIEYQRLPHLKLGA